MKNNKKRENEAQKRGEMKYRKRENDAKKRGKVKYDRYGYLQKRGKMKDKKEGK